MFMYLRQFIEYESTKAAQDTLIVLYCCLLLILYYYYYIILFYQPNINVIIKVTYNIKKVFLQF